jgi:hypothetical protein
MKQKLYLASQKVDVMFVSNESKNLNKEALHFLAEEAKNRVSDRLIVLEITDLKDIPESWDGALLWGIDDEEITPREFLAKIDAEYSEYLRLKAKFER